MINRGIKRLFLPNIIGRKFRAFKNTTTIHFKHVFFTQNYLYRCRVVGFGELSFTEESTLLWTVFSSLFHLRMFSLDTPFQNVCSKIQCNSLANVLFFLYANVFHCFLCSLRLLKLITEGHLRILNRKPHQKVTKRKSKFSVTLG